MVVTVLETVLYNEPFLFIFLMIDWAGSVILHLAKRIAAALAIANVEVARVFSESDKIGKNVSKLFWSLSLLNDFLS